MNRLSLKIAAVALGILVLAGAASGADKKPKKKKNVDLSANPLKNVNSKQPDKELFDKAMLAMKKGRFDVARPTATMAYPNLPDGSPTVMLIRLVSKIHG